MRPPSRAISTRIARRSTELKILALVLGTIVVVVLAVVSLLPRFHVNVSPGTAPVEEGEATSGGAAPGAPYREDFRSYSMLKEGFGSYPVGRWEEGSIHGPWQVSYDSNPCGRVGIVELPVGEKVYRADLSGCEHLRATKTTTLALYPTDVTVEWEFRVVSKTLATQKGWHTAWLGWAHKGDNAWNDLMLKQGGEGWEIGKFSPACPGGGANRNQCYFETGTSPQFSDGEWHTARIEQRAIPGGVQITAYGDGVRLATVRDTTLLPNTSGNVLLYNEGSVVDFRRVAIYPGDRAAPTGKLVTNSGKHPGDRVAPTGKLVIGGGKRITTKRKVRLALTARDPLSGVDQMRIKKGSAPWGAWQPYVRTKTLRLDRGAGKKSVHAKYRDRAGNVSAIVKDTIVYRR